MFLVLGSFLAGMLTVLAPCVLALLPIIVGGSVSGDVKDRRRPLIIAGSLAISLFIFTLALKATTLFINVPPRTFSYVSGVIIVILGIVTLFPTLYARFINRIGVEKQAQKALGKGFNDKRKFIGPVIIGAALGPVFSSCSPVYAYILATVLPVNFGQAMAYIISYIIGLAIVLLLIGYYGQGFISRIKFASDPKGWFQRGLAILFIVVGIFIFTGYDKKFQTYVSTHTPFDFDSLSSQLLPDSANKTNDNELYNVVDPYQAPEFVGLENWLNSDPLTIKDLKGRVVYVDFWTYSCINCIRNNPYIESWYKAYKDDGFVVVGVHAPEFAFEQIPANVAKAIKDQKLTYPVALDNDFATWGAYQNQSWPAGYLIDAEGQVVRIHEGEGEYKETEEAIRGLLTKKGANLDGNMATKAGGPPVTAGQTPETYLGTRRASNFKSPQAIGAGQPFTHPTTLATNFWSLNGNWKVTSENITAVSGDTTLRFKVSAKDVYLVGGSASADKPQDVQVLLNGKPYRTIRFGESKLYDVLNFDTFTKDAQFELKVPAGVSLNAFTFGS